MSAPAGSFVSHEVSTQPSPKGIGFGSALILLMVAAAGLILLTDEN
jgi:hypothetical protein